MATTKSRLALMGAGYAVAAALSCFVALQAEGLARQRLWRTPGLIIFFHVLPLMGRGSEIAIWLLLWVPIAVDGLILFSVICALALAMSNVYRFYNS
jgi:hypothetical protein